MVLFGVVQAFGLTAGCLALKQEEYHGIWLKCCTAGHAMYMCISLLVISEAPIFVYGCRPSAGA